MNIWDSKQFQMENLEKYKHVDWIDQYNFGIHYVNI